MINKIIDMLNSIDKNTKKLMNNGFTFCFILAIISSLFLLTYNFYSSINIYYIGFYLLKNSILFACVFFIFGLGFDKLKKELEQ